MSGAALTRKEALWLSCKQKSCCYAAPVVPTGGDVWRIARALDTPPWSFLVYFLSPEPRRDAFALDHSPRRFRIALAKGASRRARSPQPCVFLLRTRSGEHRCGLGELRPGVCRAFPSDLAGGVLQVHGDAPCSCRRWGLADVDIAQERALVRERQAGAEQYCGVVARWNALVASAPPDAGFDFIAYCTFLLERYDELRREAVAS